MATVNFTTPHVTPARAEHGGTTVTTTRRRSKQRSVWTETKYLCPIRMTGILISCSAFGFIVTSLLSSSWVVGEDFHFGVLEKCCENTSASMSTQGAKICLTNLGKWQQAVLGLLLFAIVFGSLGTLLALCGMATPMLMKKGYYFHSAGEILFVSALGSLSAMIAYPVAIITVEDLGPHRYAEGYGYGWGAVASYLTSSIYMLLDDLYRWLREVDCCRASQRETDGERTKR